MTYHTKVLGEANAGGLAEFRKSPLHYYQWATGPEKARTEPMREGSAFHMALHEPERFARTYVTIPNMPLRSVQNRADFCDAVSNIVGSTIVDNGGNAEALRASVDEQAEALGVQLLTEASLATMRAMVASLNQPCHKLVRAFVANGKKEVELRWKDPDSGVQCKALLDSWDAPNAVLSDLKRTDSILAREFKFKVLGMGYDYQMAWYRRALREHGEAPGYCPFICASPEPPYPWAIYTAPNERLDYCDEQHGMHLLTIAECITTGEWPTINNGEPVELEIRTT